MKDAMMSSFKQKGGRSGIPNQEAKKKDQSGRGRSPHQLASHQPLKGKSFYLDVRRQAAKLKKDLEDLGGVVETFLSKDISYVVSDRPEVKLECSKNPGVALQSGASPAVSTPSPFQHSKDSAHGAVDSPSASGGREGMVTRGKAIVQKATISQTYGTSNVLANARNWEVNIRYIDSVIKYINKEKQKMKEGGVKLPQTQTQQTKERAGTSKERKLSRPSLKVEDASGHYRPASKEMSSWPRLTFDGHAGSCPFDPTVHRDGRGKRMVDTQGEDRTQNRPDDKHDEKGEEGQATQTRTSLKLTQRVGGKKRIQPLHTPSRQRDVGVKDSRRGYCECCHIKYSDLEKHLASEQHRSFVQESNHYVNLDTMIDEGPNMEQFLDDVMQHHEWQRVEGMRTMDVIDEVALVSSLSVKKGPTRVGHQQLEESQDPDRPASYTDSSHGQSAKNQEHPYKVCQTASHMMSPRKKACRLPSAAVEDDAVAEEGGVASDKGDVAAAAVEGDAAAVVDSYERVVPTPADKSHETCSKEDNQQCDTQDKDIACELASSDNKLREIQPSRCSIDSQSPPERRSRKCSRQTIQISSPTTLVGNSQVTSVEHEEACCQSPNESGDKRLHIERPALRNSPGTPHRRQSSKLSMSTKRRQKQKDKASPAEVMSPEVMLPDDCSVQQPADQSRIQERVQVSEPTSNTANKRHRSLRLSLTARKRLSKESAADRPNPRKSCEDTLISNDVVSTNVEGRLKEDSTRIQGPSTSTQTENDQEMETNKAGKDIKASTPENQQQRESNSNFLQRPSKRKRNSNDIQDLGSTKNPKHRVTNTSYRAHVRQKKTDQLATSKEKTSEEYKTGGSTCQSETNPADAEGFPQERIDQVHTEDNRNQEPSQTTGSKPSSQQPNLESIFESDPNMVESSFLGFASDDITETEQRLQHLSASSTMYTNKLQEAALDVCCIPSSKLHLPEDDNTVSDSSEISDVEEVVVGMALRNLANFPSDGSEWEANVGGFMSVRLDKAIQIKQRESVLARTFMQEKENMKENQYRHILNIPGKLVPVEAIESMEQENVTKQLEQSPKTTHSSKDEAKSKRTENRSKSVDSELLQLRQALNYGSSHKTKSHRQNVDLENRTNRLQSPPLDDPLQVISSNTRVASSPPQSQKPLCSTPKHANKPPGDRQYKLMFSPDTSKEDREIILEHYVHDVNEYEIDFPKFSSPQQSNAIMSPIKNFAKSIPKNSKRSCGSPNKLKAHQVLRELSHSGSPRKSLFPRRRNSTSCMPGRVFHFLLNPPGSPRKRDVSPSLPSSPLKQSVTNLSHALASHQPGGDLLHQITYYPTNERSKVSPTFCTNSKPNFSSHILHPGNKKRHSDRLSRLSNQSLEDSSSLQRRPARTWSLCVSFDDDICCSEDVYEFTDDTKGDAETTSNQPSPVQSAIKSNTKKLQKPHSGKTSQEGKSTKAADEANRAKSKPDSSRKDTQSSDPSENEVLQEFGLPFSFFM